MICITKDHAWRAVGHAGGVQPGNGQLRLGAGLVLLQRHAQSRRAAQHTLLQCGGCCAVTCVSATTLKSDHQLAVLSGSAKQIVCIYHVPGVQLLAACERDGEADRALEAFARMERESASKSLPAMLLSSKVLPLSLSTQHVSGYCAVSSVHVQALSWEIAWQQDLSFSCVPGTSLLHITLLTSQALHASTQESTRNLV